MFLSFVIHQYATKLVKLWTKSFGFTHVKSFAVVRRWLNSIMGSYNPKGILMAMCDALRDLVPFVQFENREKHPWRSVNFSKVAGFKQYRI